MKTFHLVAILERGNARQHLFLDFRARSTKNARRRARKIILERAGNFQRVAVPFLFHFPKKNLNPPPAHRAMWRGKFAHANISDLRRVKDPEQYWVPGYGSKVHNKVWAEAA